MYKLQAHKCQDESEIMLLTELVFLWMFWMMINFDIWILNWILLKSDKNTVKLILKWELKNLWVRMYRTNNWWARKCNVILRQHLFLITRNRISCLQTEVYRTCYLCARDRTAFLQIEECKTSHLWTKSRTDFLQTEKCKIFYLQIENKTDYLQIEKCKISYLWTENRTDYLQTKRCKISYLQTENHAEDFKILSLSYFLRFDREEKSLFLRNDNRNFNKKWDAIF